MSRVRAVVAVIVAIIALVPGCRSNNWEQTAPFAPSLRPAFGVRVASGKLQFWLGTPCSAVTNVVITFDPFKDNEAELQLAPAPGFAPEVDRLVVGGPYPGLTVSTPLPAGFDWRSAKEVMLGVHTLGVDGWGSTSQLSEVVNGSAQHPDDSYWFQDVGWLNPAEVAAQNGKTFLTTCTPDPQKQPSVPAAFGARIDGDKLRIWTGTPCASTTRVTIAFEPAGNVLALKTAGEGASVDFGRYTVGDVAPGLQISQALPAGFDVRAQTSAVLSVSGKDAHAGLRTDLTEVANGSGHHPEDTYWFQGVGWLNPTDVAAQNAKTFVAVCTAGPAR